MNVETDIEYEYEIDDMVLPDYKVSDAVIDWLRGNLDNMVNDAGDKLFNKVNIGYNESSLKGLSKKPVADVYLNNINYRNTYDLNTPDNIDTVIIVTLKGNMNKAYRRALQLTDYIIQEFIENDSFRYLDRIVKETTINGTRVEINPEDSLWTVMVVFEVNHVLV